MSSVVTKPARSGRDDSVIFRASPAEKKLIQDAAASEKMDLSAYARRSALKQAEVDLATRKEFLVSEDEMQDFMKMLSRPVQNKSNLKKLLTEEIHID